MKRLVRKLGVPLYAATGILELIWHLTAREAPQGNLGKLEDADIADAVGWADDPAKLIEALTDAGWLDASDEHRLVVHDWHEHADDATDNALARSGQFYANGNPPRMNRLSIKEKQDLQVKHYAQSANLCAQKRTANHEKPLPSLSLSLSHSQALTPKPPDGPPLSPLAAKEPAQSVDLSLMNRILCEKVGIFDMRQQSDMQRMFGSYLRHHQGVSMGDSVEHIAGRWLEYQRAGPELKFRYGSAHRFFMSGIWDKPDAWERKGESNDNSNRAQARTDANIAAAQAALRNMLGPDGRPT